MPFNGAGIYSPPTDPGVNGQPLYPAVSGEVIYADDWNAVLEDLAAALSNVMCIDGQSVVAANLPMSGFKFTGMGAGTSALDSVNYDQVFNNPTFITPSASASPADGDDSTRLATTAFVQNIALGNTQYAANQLFLYQNC
jgi:hypothetical protein